MRTTREKRKQLDLCKQISAKGLVSHFSVGHPLVGEYTTVPLLPNVPEHVDHGTTTLPPVLSWNTGKEALPPCVDGGSIVRWAPVRHSLRCVDAPPDRLREGAISTEMSDRLIGCHAKAAYRIVWPSTDCQVFRCEDPSMQDKPGEELAFGGGLCFPNLTRVERHQDPVAFSFVSNPHAGDV